MSGSVAIIPSVTRTPPSEFSTIDGDSRGCEVCQIFVSENLYILIITNSPFLFAEFHRLHQLHLLSAEQMRCNDKKKFMLVTSLDEKKIQIYLLSFSPGYV